MVQAVISGMVRVLALLACIAGAGLAGRAGVFCAADMLIIIFIFVPCFVIAKIIVVAFATTPC